MANNGSMQKFRNAQGAAGTENDTPRDRNRYMGGHRRTNHPFVSGYWYFLLTPPERIFGDITSDVSEWMHSAAESFTPPTKNITKVDVPGMGGTGSSFIAGQEIDRTFTVNFREYQNLPILQTVDTWLSTIDSHFGISPLQGNEFVPANYKGEAWAILTKPTSAIGAGGSLESLTVEDIEQVFYFEGVFPESVPYDSLEADISTNDVAQVSLTFSFDGWPLTKEYQHVLETAATRMTQTFKWTNYFSNHLADGTQNRGTSSATSEM